MQHSGMCAHCGKSYSRNRPLRGDTCSRLCGARRYRGTPAPERICPTCGKSFVKPRSRQVLYCSVRCFNRRTPTRKADMIRTCACCGKQFKRHAGHLNQRCCSRKCAHDRGWAKPRICKGCGVEFMPKNSGVRYCNRACATRTISARTRAAGHIPSSDYRERPTACTRCGWNAEPGILEKHHKDRDRKNNHRDNLEYLCPNCHTLDHFKAKDGQFKNNLGRPPSRPK